MPGPPGGVTKPPNSGRQKGTPNKWSALTREQFAIWLTETSQRDTSKNPLIFLHETMCSAETPLNLRVQCAIALADRLMPRLKSVDLVIENAVEVTHKGLTPATVQAIRRQLLGGQGGL